MKVESNIKKVEQKPVQPCLVNLFYEWKMYVLLQGDEKKMKDKKEKSQVSIGSSFFCVLIINLKDFFSFVF